MSSKKNLSLINKLNKKTLELKVNHHLESIIMT